MKLKAPQGAGDPCVAGVVVVARDGLYEVEAEIGALLIECFGFTQADTSEGANTPTALAASSTPRRRVTAKKPPAEA